MRDEVEINKKFCEIIEQYPDVYDHTRQAYNNRTVQDKMWKEIAIKAGATVKECRLRWKKIRCRYATNKNSVKDPPGCAPKEYYLAPYLHFLDNFFKLQSSIGYLDNNTDGIDNNKDDSASTPTGVIVGGPQVTDFITPKPRLPQSKKSASATVGELQETDFIMPQPTPPQPKTSDDANVGELQVTDFITPQPTPPEPKKTQIYLSDANKSAVAITKREQNVDDSDADLAFFQSIIPDLRTMTRKQKRQLKIGVLNLIEDILKEPITSPVSRGSSKSHSSYQRISSRESECNSPVYVTSYGSPNSQETQTTASYGNSVLQDMLSTFESTQIEEGISALQMTQARNIYGESALQHTQLALQPTQTIVTGGLALQQIQATDAYGGLTPLYLPMMYSVTPASSQPHQTFEEVPRPHDNF